MKKYSTKDDAQFFYAAEKKIYHHKNMNLEQSSRYIFLFLYKCPWWFDNVFFIYQKFSYRSYTGYPWRIYWVEEQSIMIV